jgi:multidrug efflux pump subunit AcrB
MTCPKCGSSEIRTSRSARWSDVFQRVRGREAFRCRQCRQRFFASVAFASETEGGASNRSQRSALHLSTRTRKLLVRRLIVISIFAVMFVIFWLFLRYLTTERSPSVDSGAVSSHLTSSPS